MIRKSCRLFSLALFLAALGFLERGAAFGEGLFLPYVTHATGSYADAVAIGDVNGDGLNDAVVATTDGNDPANDHNIHVFLQQPTGELAFSAKYQVFPASYVYHPTSLDIGDLNNDGKGDVVVSASDSIGVFLQNESGALDAIVTYPTTHSSFSNSYKVRIGDFNNDDRLDVVSIDWGTQSHDVDVFLQNEAGAFDAPVVYVVGHGGYDDLEVGDVNNDGLDDIIVMSGQSYAFTTLGILLQTAGGTMGGPFHYDLTDNVNSNGVAVGDVNGDGLQDVAVTYYLHIGVFYQDVSGTLNPSVTEPSSGDTKPVVIGDVNSDGRDDIISAGGPTLEVHLQGSDGNLLPYELYTIPYQTHYKPHSLDIGDINNDGANDIAIANSGYGLVVMYNAFQPPPVPDIKVNGSDSTVYITPGDVATVSLSLDPASFAGVSFDWWIGAYTPYGTFWMLPPLKWVSSATPRSYRTGSLVAVSPTMILLRQLPTGPYLFFFILDSNPNGILDDITAKDSVMVFSRP